MGRPSKYDSHVEPRFAEIEEWAKAGATDAEIARRLGISGDTLIEYKKQFPEFSELLKKGKAVADGEVENALLKRALGYSVEEVTQELRYDNGKDCGELLTTKVVTKQVPPDVGAIAFWPNRDGAQIISARPDWQSGIVPYMYVFDLTTGDMWQGGTFDGNETNLPVNLNRNHMHLAVVGHNIVDPMSTERVNFTVHRPR